MAGSAHLSLSPPLRLRRATFSFLLLALLPLFLPFITMRFVAVAALAALAGSAAATPLVKREGCQMLACVIKVGPAAASCSIAIDKNALGELLSRSGHDHRLTLREDMDADLKCLKDGFEVLTNFPEECDGCIAEVLAGKFGTFVSANIRLCRTDPTSRPWGPRSELAWLRTDQGDP